MQPEVVKVTDLLANMSMRSPRSAPLMVWCCGSFAITQCTCTVRVGRKYSLPVKPAGKLARHPRSACRFRPHVTVCSRGTAAAAPILLGEIQVGRRHRPTGRPAQVSLAELGRHGRKDFELTRHHPPG